MEEKEVCYHVPVMLHESLEGLGIQPSGVYVDVTFGGGGHSREILNRLDNEGTLYGFDQDADAEKNIPADSRFVFVRSNFRYLYNFMRYHGVAGEVDGLLADLGVSSHHFDDKDRGFSFRFDGALDMRMNTRAGQTAADIVNTYTEEQLADLFYLYGELKVARKLASVLVRSREIKKIETIADFLEVIKPFTGKDKEKKFLAQVFQALRIEVNDEMRALREMLQQTLQVLKIAFLKEKGVKLNTEQEAIRLKQEKLAGTTVRIPLKELQKENDKVKGLYGKEEKLVLEYIDKQYKNKQSEQDMDRNFISMEQKTSHKKDIVAIVICGLAGVSNPIELTKRLAIPMIIAVIFVALAMV